ncbi:MAG: bifunctional riboflavin kinase/FAD synthetase [Chloroflexi bacterium]|nr:bifunctional riboflavin kinase/FAD synthetase [Chloroflexota bacterium]
MQIYTDIDKTTIDSATFLTIGNFDGLHRGHQALLRQIQQLAAQASLTSAKPILTGLITFDPHPLAILRPEQPLQLLTTPRERLMQAAALGIDIGVIQTFTTEIARLDAEDFMRLLKQHLGMTALIVGPDFALGRNRGGDLNTLQALSKELDYTLHIVEPVAWSGKPVRSSIVRQALQQGEVTEATELLGRYYALTGEVVQGDQRGRQIGIPTANVQAPTHKLLPANGVYATRTLVQAGYQNEAGDDLRDEIGVVPYIYNSVTNLGVRPTVDGVHHRIETHLLDFPTAGQSANLYGRYVTVEFVARLRGEQRFANLAELVAQIQTDIAQARHILSNAPLSLPLHG